MFFKNAIILGKKWKETFMLIDKKSYDLLSYLIKLEKAETVMSIANTLGQSRRKIYYHLEKINESFPETIDPINPLPRIGILLNQDQRRACQELLADVDDYHYVMKSDERMKLSAIYIAVATEKVTIDKLMHLNDVSRNTILNDLNELRGYLATKEYSIKLHSTKTRGYYFDCYPLSYITFLYQLLDSIYHGGNQTFSDFFDKKLENTLKTTTYFSEDVLQFLNDYLPISQIQLGKQINCQDSQFMIQILPYILLSYRNMQYQYEVKEALKNDFNMIWKRKEYYIAKDLAKELYLQFKLHLDDIEIGLVAMLLLSFRKDKDSHVESPDYDHMRGTLNYFLTVLEDSYHISFTHKNDLIKQLTQHCKALVYRKTYGISSVNPLTKHIKEKYRDLFKMTASCVPILEEAWKIKLSNDDIAYLTIHLGGELRNTTKKPKISKAVIVSDDGIGIQKLIYRQCQDYLNHCHIEAVLTTEQFQSISDLLDIDFLISTADSLECDFPCLTVNPILTDEDLVNLIRLTRDSVMTNPLYFSEQIEKTIAQYIGNSEDLYVLKAQIEKLMQEELIHEVVLQKSKT